MSVTAKGPAQPPIQHVPDVTSLRVKQPGHTVTTHFHLVLRLITSGSITSTPPMFLLGLDKEKFTTCCTYEARDILTSFYTLDIPMTFWNQDYSIFITFCTAAKEVHVDTITRLPGMLSTTILRTICTSLY